MALPGEPKLLSVVTSITHTFLGICTTLIYLSVSVLIYIAFFPIRQLVKYWFRYYHKNQFQLMEPMDAFFTMDNSSNSLIMTGWFLAQSKFEKRDLDELRSRIESQIVTGNYGKLQLVQCQKYGFRCWKNVDSFDISVHVKLCSGADWDNVYSETELMCILNKIINQKLTQNKPTWEVLVVPQVQAKPIDSSVSSLHVAVILRMSHGYMDGTSLLKFIQKCIFDGGTTVSLFAPVSATNREQWKFFKMAEFYLKMFAFGALCGVKQNFGTELNKATSYLQNGVQSDSNAHAFIGKVKMTTESVRKIKLKTNTHTTALFSTAFLKALRKFTERKDVNIEPPGWVRVAVTKNVAGTFANEMPQNRFAAYGRSLPMIGTMEQQLRTTDTLIHIAPENAYETIASFCVACSVGWLPDVGIRAGIRLYPKWPCLISLTPFLGESFTFRNGPVVSFFAVPPNGFGFCYAIGISNFGETISATLLVEKSSLVQSQLEFQELLDQFQGCLSLLEKIK